MEKEYYEAQVKYINEIRSIHHDMQAHLIVLQYYLESENYEKARAYLGDIKSRQNIDKMFLKDTGNDLLNVIVNDAIMRCKKPVKFYIDGKIPADFEMEEYDICTLFSNIFSNACEACEKLNVTEAEIEMEVCEKEEGYVVAIQNPIEWKIVTSKEGFVTSKQQKNEHGFGTKNMMKVMKKYGGRIDFLITEKFFRVELIFRR